MHLLAGSFHNNTERGILSDCCVFFPTPCYIHRFENNRSHIQNRQHTFVEVAFRQEVRMEESNFGKHWSFVLLTGFIVYVDFNRTLSDQVPCLKNTNNVCTFENYISVKSCCTHINIDHTNTSNACKEFIIYKGRNRDMSSHKVKRLAHNVLKKYIILHCIAYNFQTFDYIYKSSIQ